MYIFTCWINAYCILFYPDHVSGKSTGKRKTPSKEIDEVEGEDLTDIETGDTIYKGFFCSCIQTCVFPTVCAAGKGQNCHNQFLRNFFIFFFNEFLFSQICDK